MSAAEVSLTESAKREALERLRNQVDSLYEKDFGDFKRKVAVYLDRFLEEWPEKNSVFLKQVNLLRNQVLFDSGFDIEHSRRLILSSLNEFTPS